jgi:amino acid adenylation domain-containing protein/non-ribosomal peptide synthase protein (TIGR01720 family)
VSGARDIRSLSPDERAQLERRLLRGRRPGGQAPAIPRRPEGESSPLSSAQRRLWFLEQLQPGNASYNINGTARLAGVLDEHALRAALDTIVARHEALRTCFGIADGEPIQRVLPPEALAMEVVDLTRVPSDIREAEALRLVSDAAERPFELSAGPLFRAQLLRLGPADNVLAVTMHHIVSDAWSLGVFVRELGALYAAYVDGRPSPLEPLPIQYGDYAAWERGAHRQDATGAHLEYWRGRLAGPLPVLELPPDRRRPAVLTYRGATAAFEWPSDLLAAINRLSLETGGTLFTTLMAGYNALLARYTRQEDLLVGFPVAGRTRAELEPLIGFFVNMLVLRTDAAGDPPFRELLRRVREGALDAFAHQDMPFDKLVEAVQPAREMGRHPLFQAGFALQNAPSPGLQLPGITWSPLVVSRTRARFDLHVAMWEHDGRLAGTIEYSTDLFDARTIERFASHFRHLMEAAVADPDARLSTLRIASDAERRTVRDWTATGTDYPDGSTIAEEFERRVAETPDAVAVTGGGESLTYAALDARANRLAHHLRSLGVGPDVLVGVCLERSVDLVVALVGILKAGGAYVPLDSSYPRERLAFMIEDTALRFAVTTSRFLPNLPLDPACNVVSLERDWDALASAPSTNLPCAATADHLAYVIYTSGSTGRPKGVEVTHRGVLRLVRGSSYVPFDRRAVFLLLAPVSFDASTFEIWGALLNGARCVVFPDMLPTTELLGRVLADGGVTVLWLTASLFNAIVDDDPRVLAPVEQLLIGGEALSPSHVRRAYGALPNVRIVNGYGPTESTTFTCCYGIPRELPDELTSIPIGRPIANTRVYVVDSRFELQAPGVPGELCIGGDGLARGYLHRPDLTAERFVPDPFGTDGGRLYRTGDLVRWLADGTIEFLGRLDDQVKIRGFRIEPAEIEAVLRQHPGIREAVVAVRESGALGKRLVAWVVGSADSAADARKVSDAVREHARARLPEYMVPSAIAVLETMPLTPNGKLDRDRLPEPEPERGAGREYVAPRTEIEAQIAAVWSAVLNVETVGANDNFFDLGGHSLLLVKVHRQLRDRLSREISVVDLFQFPTVGALARHVAGDALEAAAIEARVSADRRANGEAIAIVGMAGRFPGARNVGAFWENLAAGVESVSFFSDEELSAAGVGEEMLRRSEYVKARAIVDGPEEFDAGFFGYNPREAALIDPQQRVFLECAWEALEDAGTDPERFDGSIGVYAGVGMNTYAARLLASPEAAGIQFAVSSDKDFLSTRVSYKLNLRGPSVNVQTACSTSLVAVHLACRGLLDGDCDMALAGGVRIAFPQEAGYLFQQGSILSPDGHCRAFDHRAAGTVSGNGAGVVVLKRLGDALAAGDPVYAVIKGTAINNDGSQKVGFTAPGVDGQADVIRRAQARAGVDPATIGYVEAHGTGTSLGDPVEIAALTRAFRAGTAETGFCAIGSLKSSVGHLDAAAGVAGLMQAALCLSHGQLPPTLNFERANPAIDFDESPFVVNTMLREWPRADVPRRAGVSAFGLGGTNAHAVLEEAPAAPRPGEARPAHLIVLSARSPEALESAASNLAAHIEADPGLDIADLAFTTQVGRRQFEYRRAVVCTDRASAVAGLRARDSHSASRAAARPSLTFMFTGQGSQQVNMMRGLYDSEPVFRRELDACIRRFDSCGIDLRAALYPKQATEEAAARLESTAIAQPALFAVEYALAQLWRSWGAVPDAMIGHSIGEYVAACLADVLSVDDAVALVAARGRVMQDAEPGAMVAVPLDEPELARHVDGSTISIAAVNGASSCVASGTFAAVDGLVQALAARGIECQRLRTSHAFHSPMMEPALGPFRQAVRQVRLHAPRTPYVSNVTGTWITAAEATDPEYWVRHLRGTVRFHEGISTILQRACLLLEVGPGHTLTSLVRPAARASGVAAVASVTRDANNDSAAIMTNLGRLWTAGVTVDWMQVHAGRPRRKVPQLPTYPFERQRYWIGMPGQGAVPAPTRLPVDRWFHTPAWTTAIPRPEPADDDVSAGVWVVFADSYGVGDSLVMALRGRGAVALRVFPGQAFARTGNGEYALRASEPSDYDALFADLRHAGADVRRIVNGWTLSPDAAGTATRGTFYSSLYLAQSLGRHFPGAPVQLGILAFEAHEIVGGEGANPSSCMALWPIRVLPLEYPNVACVGVDLGDPAARRQEDAELIVGEMAGPRDAPLVALRGGRRWVQEFRHLPFDTAADGPAPFRAGGVYLVTGGTGGVGIELGRHLAATANARIALVSRTAVPERQVWDAWIRQYGEEDPASRIIRQIESIEALGGDVLTVQADAADERQMRAAIDATVDRFGALHGVFVAAGADKTPRAIEETTREHCEAQFRSRADAVRVLDRALGDRRLDFCVLDSSLSTVLGAAGFAAYTAAHLFVDAYAARRNRDGGTPWFAIDWDNWTTWKTPAGVVHNADARYRMETAEALTALDRVLCQRTARHVIVSTGDLRSRLAAAPSQPRTAARLAVQGQEHPRPALDTPYEAPRTETERLLAGIWQDLLGIDGVGVNDNFFSLGGDSVVGIQVVARAAAAGVRLTTKDTFARQTIAELAEAAARTTPPSAPQAVVMGRVPLTPIQSWLFDQDLADLHHFNQSVLLDLDPAPAPATLERAAAAVAANHDALRLRFIRIAGGWEQHAGDDVRVPVTVVDVSHLDRAAQAEAVQREAAALQRSLDLEVGPIVRLGLFNRGPGRPAQLLVVAHHLVVDAISWRILLEDLRTACEQAGDGEIRLPAPATPFQAWARALSEHAESRELLQEVDFWTGQPWEGVVPIPIDAGSGDNTVGSVARLATTLDEEETTALLTHAPDRVSAQPNELLLASLCRAIGGWSGGDSVLVDVEGHGREPVIPGMDLSRTVGWFTGIFPFLLPSPRAASAAEILERVRRRFREVPHGGHGYGVLRYLSPDAVVRNRMQDLPRPEISFLYLGRTDQRARRSDWMRPAREVAGGNRSPRARRRHAIEVEAAIVEGCLQVTWFYSGHLHREATIEKLSSACTAALRELIAAGAAPRVASTPADFPAARLDQRELDRLLSGLTGDGSSRRS